MDVRIKNLKVAMQLGNDGVEFEIRDGEGKHIGDLLVGRANVVWCKGKTRKKNGVRVRLIKLVGMIEETARKPARRKRARPEGRVDLF